MVKIQYQITTQIEHDTETDKRRILKSWSTILGQGKTMKKPTKKKVDIKVAEETTTYL